MGRSADFVQLRSQFAARLCRRDLLDGQMTPGPADSGRLIASTAREKSAPEISVWTHMRVDPYACKICGLALVPRSH
jgi:hypothetical protein